MKINAFVEDLKTKSAAELNEELVAAKKELFNLRFQNATNQIDNIEHHCYRKVMSIAKCVCSPAVIDTSAFG